MSTSAGGTCRHVNDGSDELVIVITLRIFKLDDIKVGQTMYMNVAN